MALGRTVRALRSRIPADGIHPKKSFAFPLEKPWPKRLKALGRPAFYLVGFEAHVCVYQSAIALLGLGYRTVVVADAVGSIREGDRDIALRRLEQAGVALTSTEMALFEWLGTADHPALRHILSEVKGLR